MSRKLPGSFKSFSNYFVDTVIVILVLTALLSGKEEK